MRCCRYQPEHGAWLGPDVAGNGLLCTEHQPAQGSNDVPSLVSVDGDGCRRLHRSTAEDSQVCFYVAPVSVLTMFIITVNVALIVLLSFALNCFQHDKVLSRKMFHFELSSITLQSCKVVRKNLKLYIELLRLFMDARSASVHVIFCRCFLCFFYDSLSWPNG